MLSACAVSPIYRIGPRCDGAIGGLATGWKVHSGLDMLRSGTVADTPRSHGGTYVGRRDVTVVPAGGSLAVIPGGGHPEHAGISGAQIGIRAANGVSRRVQRVSLRPRMP